MAMLYSFLADVVTVTHTVYIGFIVFGLIVILLGGMLRWSWVRNFWFRAIHLVAMTIVVAEVSVGVLCLLTTLENHFHELAGEATYSGSCMGHWLQKLGFLDIPAGMFPPLYCLCGTLVLVTLFLIPPNWPWRQRGVLRVVEGQ